MKNSILWITLFLAMYTPLLAQQEPEDFSVKRKLMLSMGTTIKSTRYLQGRNELYKELALDYGLGNFISAGIFVGHQERHYSFVSLGSSGSEVYHYDQIFVPMGIRATMHITPFLRSHLGLDMDPEKWDVYIRYYGALALNTVDDKFNRNIHSPEQQINYSLYRTDEDMNYSAGLLTGVRFYPLKNLGLFFEGGYGPMGNFNFGLVGRY